MPGCGCRRCQNRQAWLRAAVLATGLIGPALLLGSFAFRFDLGFDAPWYVLELVAIGYVPLPAAVISLAWLAAAGQLAAIAAGRYAPYPSARERPPRGTVRVLIGHLLRFALELPAGSRPQASRRKLTADPAGSSSLPTGIRTRASAPAALAIMCDSCPPRTSSST